MEIDTLADENGWREIPDLIDPTMKSFVTEIKDKHARINFWPHNKTLTFQFNGHTEVKKFVNDKILKEFFGRGSNEDA